MFEFVRLVCLTFITFKTIKNKMRLCSVWHFVILIVLILGLSAFRFIPCPSPSLLYIPGYDYLLPGRAGQWGHWQETGGQRKGEGPAEAGRGQPLPPRGRGPWGQGGLLLCAPGSLGRGAASLVVLLRDSTAPKLAPLQSMPNLKFK